MTVELDAPPADPVAWTVTVVGEGPDAGLMTGPVYARLAFDAWRIASSWLPSAPPFGSCVVERVGGGK